MDKKVCAKEGNPANTAVAPCGLRACLLGTFAIFNDLEPVPLPGRAAASQLLAYLLLHPGRQHTRSRLACLLSPDDSETKARRNLSQALWEIGQALPVSLLDCSRSTVQLDPDVAIWIDVSAFRQRVGSTLLEPIDADRARALAEAVSLYQGDLLPGIYEDWTLLRRERLREQYLEVLARLMRWERKRAHYAVALHYGQRLVQSDPLREGAHREVMQLYIALDRPADALQQYESCVRLLQEEMQLAPQAQTVALARAITTRHQELPPPYLPPAAALPPLLDTAVSLPLIGRDPARTTILQAITATVRGQGGALLVAGEAGVGKSRLLQEVARDAAWHDMEVVWGYNQETGGASPLAGLQQALHSALTPLRAAQVESELATRWQRVLAEWFPAVATAVAGNAAPTPDVEPAQARESLAAALAALLHAWSRQTPLLIILEDLHWADADALTLLALLMPRLRRQRVLLAASYRDHEMRAHPPRYRQLQTLGNHARRLRLARLEHSATTSLVQQYLSLDHVDPGFAEILFRETGGNPLFILEIVRTLYDEGLLTYDDSGGWQLPAADEIMQVTAPVVETVIGHRLARLPAPARAVLEMAAVLGRVVDVALLQAVRPEWSAHELNIRLQILVQRRFLEAGEQTYRFAHARMRKAAYANLAEADRCRYHRQAAAVWKQLRPGDVGGLAYHAFQGKEWAAAANACLEAGNRAADRHAHQEALTYYHNGLFALDQLPAGEADLALRRSVLLRREALYNLLGERAAQMADLDALEALAQTTAQKAELALRRARLCDALGHYSQVRRAAAQALRLARRTTNLPCEAAACALLGFAWQEQHQYERAKRILQHGLNVARQGALSWQEARCRYVLSTVYQEQNRQDEAIRYAEKALQQFRALGDRRQEARCLNQLAIIYADAGHVEAERAYKLQTLQLQQAIGDRRGEAASLYNLSVHYHEGGDDDAALRHCRRAAAIGEEIQADYLLAYVYTYLALLLEETDAAAAEDYCARALAIRRAIGQPQLAVDSLAGLARAALRRDKVAAAREHIAAALDWIAQHGMDGVGDVILVYLTAYRVYHSAGETARAVGILTRAYRLLLTQAPAAPGERRAFLENLSYRQEVISLYHALFQTAVSLAHVDAPTGRPLRPDEQVTVYWTITTPADDAVPHKVTRRRHRLQRMLQQAAAQQGAPTVADLAAALEVSPATVKRDLAALRAAGYDTPTRGSR